MVKRALLLESGKAEFEFWHSYLPLHRLCYLSEPLLIIKWFLVMPFLQCCSKCGEHCIL